MRPVAFAFVVVPALLLGSPTGAAAQPEGLSVRARLLRVRRLPVHRNEPVADPAWLELIQEGAALGPDLVALVGDGTPMRDPRPEAHWTQFAVGDLALLLLVELGLVDFDAVVKPLVGDAAYREHGALAYANWVIQGRHRADLAAAVRTAWAARPR